MSKLDRVVGVVGLGYVGLPLAVALTEAGRQVVGIDASDERRRRLRAGDSPVADVVPDRLRATLAEGLVIEAPSAEVVRGCDALFVCVPTPLDPAMNPDLSQVLGAAASIAAGLRAGQLVILQSTTYPGTTVGPFRAELERSGLLAGRDFDLAFAPERISPGDPSSHSAAVPRLVGGLTPEATERAASLVELVSREVIRMSSPDAAELAKLHENVFRNVNIALVNQLALLCERMGLDAWEVIDAAATKPFGFMRFSPGPGVGGHCIPIDPYYLAWRARELDFVDRFVETAGDINLAMPRHVVGLCTEALNDRQRSIRGARIGVIGVAFKPNVGDTRNSPAAAIMALLRSEGAELAYHDPLVPEFADGDGVAYRSEPLGRVVEGSDLVLIVTAHRDVDWPAVFAGSSLVVDTVNASQGHALEPRQVLRLGAAWSSQPG